MKALVVGFGISGKAAKALLEKQGYQAAAVDRKPSAGVELDRADFPLEGFDLVVASPGIPPEHPILQRARDAGVETIGEIELAFRSIKNRCVGITGSNGKTTTVLLTAHVLNAAGKKARALGNVGDPLSGYSAHPDPEEILVIELSSFQLETLEQKRLDCAAILNITPNHLDRHPSMEAYAAAKFRIRGCLKEGGKFYVSRQVADEFGGGGEVFDEKNFPERYNHLGRQSVLAAFTLCADLGVSEEEFWRAADSFRKPPHRIEWVAEIGGVSYYNDSKSSNIHSVMHAVALLKGPIRLLIGGVHKGASYRPWIEAFRGKVNKIYAFGAAAPLMEEDLAEEFPFQRTENMAEALAWARREAGKKETVLLSPGCSSYDQFRNYEHRGDEFKRLVKEM